MHDLTPNQLNLRARAWDFAVEEIRPLAAEIDATASIPAELRQKMAERRFPAVLTPLELDGMGLGCFEVCLVAEGLAYGSMAVGSTNMATTLCQTPLYLFGTDRQRQDFMEPIMRGEAIGTIGITEPNHGSDAASMQMTATSDGATYVLDGEKRYIDNVEEGDLFLTWAKTDPTAEPRWEGMSAFIVRRDDPGFEVVEIYDMLGTRGLGVGSYSLNETVIPDDRRIGQEGQGWEILMRTLELGRTGTAALCVGLAQAALDEAKAYAKERVQFGQVIGKHQLIQEKLANMSAWIETARLLTYSAARTVDSGQRADRESSMAKFYAADAVLAVAHDALQIYGGKGYMKPEPVERYFRDARLFSIGEGTSEIQRLVVARRTLQMGPESERVITAAAVGASV